jgi:hypothetical protein
MVKMTPPCANCGEQSSHYYEISNTYYCTKCLPKFLKTKDGAKLVSGV